MLSHSANCPCGSLVTFGECCQPLLTGKTVASGAEALMRSRFSAYATDNFAYVLATYAPEQRQQLSLNELQQSAAGSSWLKLNVQHVSQSGLNAKVEFSAYYRSEQHFYLLHETSDFICLNKLWFYTTGVIHKDSGVYQPQRNDLCLCGSGKKYKKCCA